MKRRTLSMAPLLLLLLAACDPGQERAAPKEPPKFESASPVQTPAQQVAAITGEAAARTAADGEQVYRKACAACHEQGIAGAPKVGDRKAWEPRIAQGMETLVNHAVHGFTGSQGMMPAKGGNPTLADAEVGAAVRYMVKKSR